MSGSLPYGETREVESLNLGGKLQNLRKWGKRVWFWGFKDICVLDQVGSTWVRPRLQNL